MCDKVFVETCLHGRSHAWSLFLPAVGSFACEIFSLEGLLCGPLVLPRDLPVGGERQRPPPLCLSHHSGHLSLCVCLFVYLFPSPGYILYYGNVFAKFLKLAHSVI